MKAQIWTAEFIREQMKITRKSFILKRGNDFRDLGQHKALTLEGDFQIQETANEVIVTDNYRRMKAPSGL